ncbi:cell division protein FtsQ/DivIB [Bacillus sp. FJAT-42315]|uniref:cell division protein FtsQ/DivIB n=1 Tax=Bacillus sp. FJAT-42315 TaxID=2014077 RepID=UPI000C24ADC4|nr:FtsQ-type POTRA domain-containing protein [Bacillus sp. FJAT-42315]
MEKGKIISIEERIPKLKKLRKRKTNRRLASIISLFFLIVITIVYFQSPLSRVQQIDVIGNHFLSKDEVIETSGLREESSVWSVNKQGVAEQLQRHPKIKEAVVSFSFPNKLVIKVEERAKLAYLSKGRGFYPVLDNGTVLKTATTQTLDELPVLHGFKEGKVLDDMMNSLGDLPNEITNSISEIYYKPKKTDSYHIQLFMNDGFEVSASLKTFSDKMVYYPSIVSQLDPNVKGVIDIEIGSYFRAYDAKTGDQEEQSPVDP